ncbi:cyclic pyranopterin monophosphate synthase [Candidatus Methylomirabilis lanthanidiphila]|uniref:GTP 3',8-cyclase n=1 Tax=Candidatus Methylomirabilis lanthanidiphila TaxID=2211376 RepID=A0A564ZNU9_9BACT|nr:GTP 3',8-cyclase MoaA [Candidatus Methylomirabilis lanthanidiphila]VUZ86527.1 cyclic pyranopterin monophosphate synthase [Candidatus Methylomirabilis lanthanidiphila]
MKPSIEHPPTFLDLLSRPLRSLRLSVTDRCNLRCQYCMPEEEYVWLPRKEILTLEEASGLVDIFVELGVNKVRLTGGEPLVRRDLAALVKMIARNPRIEDLAITTNGLLLAESAQALYDAGLHRVTVSLDTLRPDRFTALTRKDSHAKVLNGIEAAQRAGFKGLKIDSVIMRGVNDDELADLLEFGKQINAEIRFIEYMDVGGATHWSMEKVFSRTEILEVLMRQYGRIEPVASEGWAPADQFVLPDGTVFGIVASTTTPFCRTCDRSRLTADGRWYLCLYAQHGIDLRAPLRAGASKAELMSMIVSGWTKRSDRGAEERNELRLRDALVSVEELRQDPHLEMHTRGG